MAPKPPKPPTPPFGTRAALDVRDEPNESADLAARDGGALPLYSEAASELTSRVDEVGLMLRPPVRETHDVSTDAYVAHRMNCVEPRDIGALWDRAERLAFRNITVRVAAERCNLYRLFALGTHLSDARACVDGREDV